MSEGIEMALKNGKETAKGGVPEINLSFSLSEEKIYRIRELLMASGKEINKELADAIIRMIAEEERGFPESVSLIELDEAATYILSEFGIPAHTKGYRYLKDALVLVARKPLLVDGITKGLYPAIAELHGTTSARVERVVRHAIESGCTRGDTQALYHYFPHSISKDKLKPTNAEFIAVMGDVVKKRVAKRQLVFADI